MTLVAAASPVAHPPTTHSLVRLTPTTALVIGIGFQLALLVPSVIALAIDPRTLNDISVWVKPIKFQVSLSLHLFTLALLLPLISSALGDSRLVRVSVAISVIASTYETIYITFQSARGVASHYNIATPIESVMYSLMGIGAVALVVGAFGIGLAIARSPAPSNATKGLHIGAATGLMVGAVATLITAAVLSTGVAATGHWIGGELSDANGLPLVGWSTTGGDLRVAHFFATHLMQALPIVGLLADRFVPGRARLIVILAMLIGIAIVAATFVQALAGQPLIALSRG